MTSASEDRARNVERAVARHIFAAFKDYNRNFREITRRAERHFLERDWATSRSDVVQRIELYNRSVLAARDEVLALLGGQGRDRPCWAGARLHYARLIAQCADSEFYKTFFSSITRRIFDTRGVDPDVEFLAEDVTPVNPRPLATRIYRNRGSLYLLFDEILSDLPFARRFAAVETSLRFIAAEIGAYRTECGIAEYPREIEIIPSLFYRGRQACLVARIRGTGWDLPLVLPFAHRAEGVTCESVILAEAEVSMLFGFTRSYFHVDLDTVGSAVRFLKELLPEKPVEEIYTVLGRAKQGKTERYGSLMRHMTRSSDRFVVAAGAAGMVMSVFTLPSFNVVFKVIRDRFDYPKTVRPSEVREKYELVFKHDRAGRLVDAQEFRRLTFDAGRFDPTLKEELLASCSRNCSVREGRFVIEHLYIERRLVPLNLYLRDATAAEAERAVIDYGQALRDLASSNIFAGDLLVKNFGVSRHGRVVFYDYDEVVFVTECNFRPLPESRRPEEEMAAEPWYFVGPNDVFPEEFIRFFGFSEPLRKAFLTYHGELLSHVWWSRLKERLARGEAIEVLPYPIRNRTTLLPGAGTRVSRRA